MLLPPEHEAAVGAPSGQSDPRDQGGMRAARTIGRAFAEQRKRLWGVCYRMSGCPADADDLLQETFERALASPPQDLERDLAPWLMRVAINRCRDHLRRRRQRGYIGPFLPGPLETRTLLEQLDMQQTPEARYGVLESVSLAFLHALEALTPNQRAVLVLRDVLDCSVQQTASALELSEAAVKTTLHRARTALLRYDADRRCAPSIDPARAKQIQSALEAFMVHLLTGNLPALTALLADDVVAINDGNGEYFAARRPVIGRDKVVLFNRKTMRAARGVLSCSLNGTPAMLLDLVPVAGARGERLPRRVAVWIRLDASGRIQHIHAAVARRKLARLPWSKLHAPTPALALRMTRSALQAPGTHAWAQAWMRTLAMRASAQVARAIDTRLRG